MAPGVERCVVTGGRPRMDDWRLIEHGTMSFEQVVTPALGTGTRRLHRQPNPGQQLRRVRRILRTVAHVGRDIRSQTGGPLKQGEVSINTALARTFGRLIATEKSERASRPGSGDLRCPRVLLRGTDSRGVGLIRAGGRRVPVDRRHGVVSGRTRTACIRQIS